MKIFIGCSSKTDIDKVYLDDCKELISKIAKLDDVELVYGDYNKGIMGIAYQAFKENGKKVIGVSTDYYYLQETEKAYDELIVAKTTTGRFEKIHEISDVLLFLPGGLGTYAELFSAIEEHKIENGKKIILYNDNYFYTPLIKELYQLYQKGFVSEVPSDYMLIEQDIEKIVEVIEEEREKNE